MRFSRTAAAAIFTACALLVAGTPAWGQDANEEAAILRAYYSGNGLLNRGMYDLAAAEYRQFLDEHPNHEKAPLAQYGLAVSLFRLNRYGDAVKELGPLRRRARFEYGAEVLMILGQCQLALENYDESAACFRDVLRDHDDHDLADDAAALAAEALYESGHYEEVETPCALLVSRWPTSPLRERAELFWGLAAMAQGKYGAAVERFGGMIERYPDGEYADQTTLLLGQCLHRTKALPLAAEAYRKVIDRAKDAYVPDAMYGLALLLHQQGAYENAGDLLDRMLDQYPTDEGVPNARLLRGRVWFDMRKYGRAFELFERLSTGPGELRDDAAYWMAKCELRQDDAAGAAKRLRRALSKYRTSELAPEMTYDYAVALLRAGDAEAALDTLEGFRGQFPDHPLAADALHLTASTLHQERRYQDSLEHCGQFQEKYGQHDLAPAVAFLVAENQFLLGRYEPAADAYRRLLSRYPEHDQGRQAMFRLGMALYHQQAFDEAAELLTQVTDGRETAVEFRAGLLALGDGRFQQGEWRQAEQDLTDYLSFGLGQPSADDALLKLGLSRHRQDQVEAALEAYDQLIGQFPESPRRIHAVFERGQALVELDRPDDAAAAFEEVLARAPNSRFAPHALNHLGSIALERDEHTEAAVYFGRAAAALRNGPEGGADMVAEAMFQQGQALMSSQQFGQAVDVLSQLLEEFPSHERRGQALALRAIGFGRRAGAGDHERAVAEIAQIEATDFAGLDASMRTALAYEKAWSLRELERPQEAALAYRAVLEQRGTSKLHHHASLELAELEIDAERYDVAADLLRELRQNLTDPSEATRPLREQGTYNLGLCEFHLGRLEVAADLLEEFISGFPKSDLVLSASLLCGEALYKTGRHKRAVTHLQRLVDRVESGAVPEAQAEELHAPGLLRLGECQAALQRWQRSEKVFDQYLKLFAESPLWYQAQFGIGWARENQGRHDDAIAAYRLVTDRHQGPTAARAQFQIGECLFAQRRLDEAARELLKVDILYAYPKWSAAALYEAGRCFEEMGDPVDARKQYEQVQQQYPQTRWAEMAADRLTALARSTLPGH
ncbi:MAG: tetratricopeptide repeat protein [Planctomycetota bacterium]|jgi:TolA-binding protein